MSKKDDVVAYQQVVSLELPANAAEESFGLQRREESTVVSVVSVGKNNTADATIQQQQKEEQEQDLQQHQQRRRILLGASFWSIGLLNNTGYVIMIASAKDISEGGVALVFLANILPGLSLKATAPYWFERVSYGCRLGVAAVLMATSFVLVAWANASEESGAADDDSNNTFLGWQLAGVAAASAQGGLGEASLLALAGTIDGRLAQQQIQQQQRSHHKQQVQNPSKDVCLNGFASGTGAAGVFGFFWKWFWNDLLGFSLSLTLCLALVLVVAYFLAYRCIDALRQDLFGDGREERPATSYRDRIVDENENHDDDEVGVRRSNNNNNSNNNGSSNSSSSSKTDLVEIEETTTLYGTHNEYEDEYKADEYNDGYEHAEAQSLVTTVASILQQNPNSYVTTTSDRPGDIASMSPRERFGLVLSLWPYTVPLFTVYAAEYTLQSGTWSAIGFPVTSKGSRDRFYEYSNWIYQAGVFVSRSSGSLFTAPMGLLWAMPVLQTLNVIVYWAVAAHDGGTDGSLLGWYTPWFLYPTAFYTGLLGGGVYVHGYLRICKDLRDEQHREFALSATSLAESLGIVVADVLGLVVQACLYEIHGLDGAVVDCPATMTTTR